MAGQAQVQQPAAPLDLFESKIHPPPAPSGVVARDALVQRIAGAPEPIVSVVAPAGYGKTTLLGAWAGREPERVAWLSLDRHDNDLGLLVTYATAALNRVRAIDPELLRPNPHGHTVASAATRVVKAMTEPQAPVALVLDNVELLENPECVDAVAEVALHLPDGARLALATRTTPQLPIPRLRADRKLVEVGVDDLTLSEKESGRLLASAGFELSDADVALVAGRTEGWPVGLYLATLALKAGRSRDRAGVGYSGDDQLIAQYLRAEVLSARSQAEIAFLTRTAVLERMSGPLCDAVLEASGSGEILESLARSNGLVLALDRRGEWYRFHYLFRDLLRNELQRREPTVAPQLHRRASQWFESNGEPDMAIDHAQAAGDADRVNELFLVHAPPWFAAGRGETVRGWMRWFDDQNLLEQYPGTAAVGALVLSGEGRPGAVERWAAVGEIAANDDGDETRGARFAADRVLPDGSTLQALRAVMGISLARDGASGLRRDSELALRELGPASGYRPLALLGGALAHVLDGDSERADVMFERAANAALDAERIPTAIISLAERGLIAIDGGRWDDAARFVDEALIIIAKWDFEHYSESALPFAVAARVDLHAGGAVEARAHLASAARLRPALTYVRPTISVQVLHQMSLAYALLADTAGAREVLRQAHGILRHRPDLGVLREHVAELQTRIDGMRVSAISVSALTAAELRIVPYLPTHLTFQQIAVRLFVSRNTVKSHTAAIYRKLGVASRGAAIEQLQELGLLDG